MSYKDKEKQREFNRRWQQERRDAFFRCKSCHCGSTLNLELDHRDSSEKISHSIWSWAERKRLIEISKCDILCRSCHEEKTTKTELLQASHGSLRLYRRGCRCELCFEKKKLSNATSHGSGKPKRRSPIKWTEEMDQVILSVHCGLASRTLGVTVAAVNRRRDSIRIKNPGIRFPYQDLPAPKKY